MLFLKVPQNLYLLEGGGGGGKNGPAYSFPPIDNNAGFEYVICLFFRDIYNILF